MAKDFQEASFPAFPGGQAAFAFICLRRLRQDTGSIRAIVER
ncbi:hypothetical protein [Flavobacterium album]|nr:hypothetical protein [Flavobacterium album]